MIRCSSSTSRWLLLGLLGFTATGCFPPGPADQLNPMPVIRVVLPDPGFYGLDFETVELAATNGETLVGWFVPNENPRGTVLINPGAVFSRSWPLPQVVMFHELGCNVFIYDYQGSGESTGTATLATVLDDANVALDWVRNSGRPATDRIVLFGLSLGTMPCMAQAADAAPDIAGMIVEGTVQQEVLVDLGFIYMGIAPGPDGASLVPDALDPIANAPRISVPSLYLQSIEDGITPFDGVVQLVDATPEPKQLAVVEGIHGLGIFQDPDYVEIVSGFMDEVLGQ